MSLFLWNSPSRSEALPGGGFGRGSKLESFLICKSYYYEFNKSYYYEFNFLDNLTEKRPAKLSVSREGPDPVPIGAYLIKPLFGLS